MVRRSASASLDEHLIMAASFSRSLADERQHRGKQGFNARDALMYDHFKWHSDRLPPDARIVVWCATIHAAKDLSGVPGREGFVPLGAHIHGAYGDRAAAVGFSAYTGHWARIRQAAFNPIPEAPPGSIEAQVSPDQDLRYFGPDQLRAFGEILARPLNHDAPQERAGVTSSTA